MTNGMDGIKRICRLSGLMLVSLFLLGGCASSPPPTQESMPLHVLLSPEGGGQRAVVFLPGREDTPSDLRGRGLVEMLRAAHPDVDVYIPDAHRGYYSEGTVVERLNDDVLAPLRTHGYERIIVVGISMGGLGALLHVQQYPENVDGIVLIAPYLGEEDLIERVREKGGVRAWDGPAPAPGEPIGSEQELWGWFAEWPDGQPEVPIFVAYGRDDPFAEANGMLASLLPREFALVVEGEHDWPTWRKLWQEFLSRGVLLTEP